MGYIVLCTKAPSWYDIAPPVDHIYENIFNDPEKPYAWEWFIRDGVVHIGLLIAWSILIVFTKQYMRLGVIIILFDQILETLDFLVYNNKWDVVHLLIQNNWLIGMMILIIIFSVLFNKDTPYGTS